MVIGRAGGYVGTGAKPQYTAFAVTVQEKAAQKAIISSPSIEQGVAQVPGLSLKALADWSAVQRLGAHGVLYENAPLSDAAVWCDALPSREAAKSLGRAIPSLPRAAHRVCQVKTWPGSERPSHDSAMRWIVGGKAIDRGIASPSHLGCLATHWLAADANLTALNDLSEPWIDRVHRRKPPKSILPDVDSTASPTHAPRKAQPIEATSGAPASTPCSCSTRSTTGSAVACALASSTALMAGGISWFRSWCASATGSCGGAPGVMPPLPCRTSTSISGPKGAATLCGFPRTASSREVSATCCGIQGGGRQWKLGGTSPAAQQRSREGTNAIR